MLSEMPEWLQLTSFGSLDELFEVERQWGAPRRREVLGKEKFQLKTIGTVLSGCNLGWAESTTKQRVHAIPAKAMLQIPFKGYLVYQVGHEVVETSPETAMLLDHDIPYVRCGHDEKLFSMQIDILRLERMRQHLLDEPIKAKHSRPRPMSSHVTAKLRELIMEIPAHRNRPSDEFCEAWVEHIHALIVEAELPTSSRSASRLALNRIRQVEDWVDGHLAERITLSRLCEVAGIDARGLQKSFVSRHGMSPMRWIWARRMAAARMHLLGATSGESVTRIAQDVGLTHAGRFAVEYFARYGESPSVTLALALSRHS